MTFEEQIFNIAFGLLNCPADRREDTFKRLQEHFKESIEFNNYKKLNAFSLGGFLPESKVVGLFDWVRFHTQEGPCRASAYDPTYQEKIENLPLAVQAAFAGNFSLMLKVENKKAKSFYVLSPLNSRRHLMQVADFEAWINTQEHSTVFIEKLTEYFNETREMSGQEKLRLPFFEFLKSEKGIGFFDIYAESFLSQIQLVARSLNYKLKVGSAFEKFMYSPDPDKEELEYLKINSPQEALEFVPRGDYLNIKGNPSSQDFFEFLSAQKNQDELWARVSTVYQHVTQKPQSAEALKKNFTVDPQFFYLFLTELLKTTKKNNSEIVMPEKFKNVFEKVSDSPHYVSPKETLLLSLNVDESFETYVFCPLYESIPEKATDYERGQKQYLSALVEITTFADKIKSPFTDAFKLAHFIMQTQDFSFDNFDEMAVEGFLAECSKHLSKKAIKVLSDRLANRELYRIFSWPEQLIRSFVSLSVANVFGGMGSWNDQYLSEVSDQERFSEISEKMLKAMKAYQVATLNSI